MEITQTRLVEGERFPILLDNKMHIVEVDKIREERRYVRLRDAHSNKWIYEGPLRKILAHKLMLVREIQK